jgi:FixJ family two-component response regulator
MTVMRLVVSGLLNKQVADELGITESTVKAQRDVVMQEDESHGAKTFPFASSMVPKEAA